MAFKISEKYNNTDWTGLTLVDGNSTKWAEGISIIKDRFDSRFFNHINNIRPDEFSGFVIMAIDCLLIETLMQFYLGADNTEVHYKGKQWMAFTDFFKNSSHFSTAFKTNQICHTFYQHFRCGLLHQAQTKKKSLIKVCEPELLSFAAPTNINAGLIIDREKFHDNLVSEFNDYLKKLTNNENNFKGNNLRINAIAKMTLICAE